MRTLTLYQARRLTLASLGLARARPDGRRDRRHLRRVVDHVRVVQLDSVQVLARAHELPFWSRLGAHDRAARDRWLWRSGELFEGWVHVASMAPVAVWPWLHHRRTATRTDGRLAEALERDPLLLERITEEVAGRGPTSVSDLDDPGHRTGPWWGHPVGKDALVHLAATGRLAVHDRTPNFVTRYDLAERVLPAEVLDAEPPDPDRATELLLAQAIAAQGIGTADHLADHHRLRIRPAQAALERMASRGEVERVRVHGTGDETFYLDPSASVPRKVRARTLVSPFDPVVWHRDRTEQLFGFRYRIEIYVPAAKRVHGYYVLPFLLGDDLVARVDLKADRRGGRLLVLAAFLEPGRDAVHVARELAAELREFADWLELTDVEVRDRGDLAPALATAVSVG